VTVADQQHDILACPTSYGEGDRQAWHVILLHR